MTELEAIVKAMKEKLDKIALVILGDPTDDRSPGVMIRLDRLEQSDRFKTKMMWILTSGVVAIISKALFTWF